MSKNVIDREKFGLFYIPGLGYGYSYPCSKQKILRSIYRRQLQKRKDIFPLFAAILSE